MDTGILLDDIYKRNPSIISRRIQGEAVLVPIRQRVGDLDAIYALNETASLVWSVLDGQQPLRQVLATITTEFEVEDGEAAQDLLELMVELTAVGAVEKV